MPKFHYNAIDAHGQPDSGEIEADGPVEARGQLVERGLAVEASDLVEIEPVARAARMSAAEATGVAHEMADLAQSELPLAPGLRAVADELGRGRAARAFRAMAERIERGESLETLIEAQGTRFPSQIRGLILAGIRSGRLPELLDEFVDVQQARLELRRRIWQAMAYPTVLFGLAVGLLALFGGFIIPQFEGTFYDLDADLPAMTQLVLWLPRNGHWVLLGLAACLAVTVIGISAAGRPSWPGRVLYAIPVVGPLWRWAGLAEFARLMRLLLDQNIPLAEAFRLTAGGLREPDLRRACRKTAERIESGMPLPECLDACWQFPATLKPMVVWALTTPRLSDAFQAAAELYERRTRLHTTLLEVIALPIVFAFVIGSVGFMVLALFMPMISLISKLT